MIQISEFSDCSRSGTAFGCVNLACSYSCLFLSYIFELSDIISWLFHVASIHMPRIGYQDGTDRSQWYTVERLLRKYASVFGIKIYVYVLSHTDLYSPHRLLCVPAILCHLMSLQVLLSTIILRLVLCPLIPWPLSCSSKNRVEIVMFLYDLAFL
jgi:hypothetical protein